MAECLFYKLSGCGFENRCSQYNMVSIHFSKQQKLKTLLSFPSSKLKKNIPEHFIPSNISVFLPILLLQIIAIENVKKQLNEKSKKIKNKYCNVFQLILNKTVHQFQTEPFI